MCPRIWNIDYQTKSSLAGRDENNALLKYIHQGQSKCQFASPYNVQDKMKLLSEKSYGHPEYGIDMIDRRKYKISISETPVTVVLPMSAYLDRLVRRL